MSAAEIQQRVDSARKLRKRGNYSYQSIPDTTRVKLMKMYSKEIPAVNFSSMNLAQIIASSNTPYRHRRKQGLYYADDYCKLYSSKEPWWTISGLANSNFWDMSKSGSFFCKKSNVLASQALNAFWHGPTFPDCANVIQAGIYQLILNIIGPERFDKIFTNEISPFLITKWLYQSFESTSKENPQGNPLFYLFDKVDKLQPGDICYVKGVQDYQYKHLAGFAPGWNLVCVTAGDNPTFVGFGPDTFTNGSITFDELRIKLIEYYNLPQSKETKLKIEKFKPKIGSSSVEDNLNQVKISLAENYADDQKPLDSNIVGLEIIIRLNKNKLKTFLKMKLEKKVLAVASKKSNSKKKTIIKSTKKIFSVGLGENQKSTFKNFVKDTPDKIHLYNTFLTFAIRIQKHNSGMLPLGLFVSGNAGIGKTHLSNAVMNAITNKKILYVDEDYISQEFQAKGLMPNFQRWFSEIDLIILDDINTEFGSASEFFKKSLEYIFKYNKSIIVTSNQPINILSKALPRYIGYLDPIMNNFIVINNFKMLSLRQKWIASIIGLENPIMTLINYSGDSAAGTIKIDKQSTANKYKKEIEKFTKKKKVRVALDPYKNQVVFDLYMYDLDKYQYFVIEVFNSSQAEQLVNLVNHVHHNNKKVLVITNSIDDFKELVLKKVNLSLKKSYKIRRQDRLRILFPGVFDTNSI